MKLSKVVYLVACAAILLFAAVGCGGQSVQKVVATVNDEALYREELDNRLSWIIEDNKQQGLDLSAKDNKEMLQDFERQVLDEMINNTVLLQQVNKEGIEVSNDEVTWQIQQIKSQFEDDKQFYEALKTDNLSEEELAQQITDQLKIEQYLAQKIGAEKVSVSEDEIKEYYNQLFANNPEEEMDFEELKPQLELMLQEEKFQAAQAELLESLKEQINIEIML